VHRAAVATAGQRPFAVVFGCSDSRLAAEIIFDRGLGDLFVVRTAGHVVGPEVVASIEYGVSVLGVPLVVVLGHDSCGALAAATEALAASESAPAGLNPIIEGVVPSIERANARGITDPDRIAEIHVQRTIEAVVRQSAPVRTAIANGRCATLGLAYRLAEGRVTQVAGDAVAVPSTH
jgi:carbonic anhydrase